MEYEDYFKILNLDDKTPEESLIIIGSLIDASFEVKRMDGLDHALKLAEELKNKPLTSEQLCRMNYYLGNAWDNKRKMLPDRNPWIWEHDEIEKEIIHLRLALKEDGFNLLKKVDQCQILTNLGNFLDEVGRTSEAFECWNKALVIDPEFAMALGNRARGAKYLAKQVRFNRTYSCDLIQCAYYDLIEAFKHEEHFHPGAKKYFEHSLEQINRMGPEDALKDKPKEERIVRENKDEEKYRNWCLSKKLYLNPVNDLGQFAFYANDNMHLPPITGPTPKYHGLFNQIKQEFVSARYLFYEGSESFEAHFSDKDVYLADTLDYPSYCLAVEKVKLSFKSFYSILDRIAFFVNDYLAVGIPERIVSFKSLWYEKLKGQWNLRSIFVDRKNWCLRGLFWLSKDLFEIDNNFKEALEPNAQALQEIRNHLEHKYLKVHEMGNCGPGVPKTEFMDDILAYSILRKDLISKTEKMMKLARAAIIYLVIAVHHEEQAKNKTRDIKLVMPMDIHELEDEWKR